MTILRFFSTSWGPATIIARAAAGSSTVDSGGRGASGLSPARRRRPITFTATAHSPRRGRSRRKLWISSTAPDTDFTAKLIDEIPPNPDYPLGFDLNIGDSILRLRYREGLDHQAAPLKPDEIVPITITLYPTSNVFK